MLKKCYLDRARQGCEQQNTAKEQMKISNYTTTINMHLAVADKSVIYRTNTAEKLFRQAAQSKIRIMRGGVDVHRQLTLFVEKEGFYIIWIQHL